jgi:hypothetical protein
MRARGGIMEKGDKRRKRKKEENGNEKRPYTCIIWL